MLDKSVRHEFTAGPGYLNTASVGLPPKTATTALRASVAEWEAGRADPASFDTDVDRARRAYAQIAGTKPESVGIVGQVSVATGLVASCLPNGASVLCAEEDFTSVLFPFLADRRLNVQLVPLDDLIDHIGPTTDLVAVSAVQSADGRVLDLERLATVCRQTQTRSYVDVTQAAGWLPIATDNFDVTACGAYKWLCSPRGTGFITVRPDVSWLVPRYAGWYSGEAPWQSIYGAPLRLAADARRFNVSPAWFGFVAAARSIECLAAIGVDAIQSHSVGLANAFRAAFGLAPSNSAIVSIDTPHGDSLTKAGITAATRAGKVRLSFYLYNTMSDVEQAIGVLTMAKPPLPG